MPYANALELASGYNRTGVTHRLYPLLGKGHGCWNALTAQNQTQDEAGFAFLAKVLKLGGQQVCHSSFHSKFQSRS